MLTKENYLKNPDGSTMKDYLGNEIHIGDKVAYHKAHNNNTKVNVGVVVFPDEAFQKEYFMWAKPRERFVYFNDDNSWNHCRAPYNVIVISK